MKQSFKEKVLESANKKLQKSNDDLKKQNYDLQEENEKLKSEIELVEFAKDKTYEDLRELISSLNESKRIYEETIVKAKEAEQKYEEMKKELVQQRVSYKKEIDNLIKSLKLGIK